MIKNYLKTVLHEDNITRNATKFGLGMQTIGAKKERSIGIQIKNMPKFLETRVRFEDFGHVGFHGLIDTRTKI